MIRVLLLIICMPTIALATSAEWKLVGKGEMHKLFWHVYDTSLKTPTGSYDPSKPYALENTYHMDFSDVELAERSIKEMRLHAEFTDAQAADWLAQLVALWPDVNEGDRIRAKAFPGERVMFYHNATRLGSIDDAAFVKPFMDIWLGENSSEPDLRNALLGK